MKFNIVVNGCLWVAVAANLYMCISGWRINRRLAMLEKELKIEFLKQMMDEYARFQKKRFAKAFRETADEIPVFLPFGPDEDHSTRH